MCGRWALYGSRMNQGLTIADVETDEETNIGVRVVRDGLVGLAAPQRSGSEIEVFLTGADAMRLAELLRVAGAPRLHRSPSKRAMRPYLWPGWVD
jgi:hypothetical protein